MCVFVCVCMCVCVHVRALMEPAFPLRLASLDLVKNYSHNIKFTHPCVNVYMRLYPFVAPVA